MKSDFFLQVTQKNVINYLQILKKYYFCGV